MRKVYGLSETIYDILFRNNQPVAAVPGGSVFNGLITLGRLGVPGCLISEVGDDRVGHYIESFLLENGISPEYLSRYPKTKTAISLAYLNENNDAEYSFYKDYANVKIEFNMPPVQPDDVVMFGSYYALNPVLRPTVLEFLKYARSQGAILYYDLNFRSNHKAEAQSLIPSIRENFRLSDIVRGSADDFNVLYGVTDPERIYKEYISQDCSRFICTCGSDGVALFDGDRTGNFCSRKITPVSTIGAGDNFNAGIVYGLIRYGITRQGLPAMTSADWKNLVDCGIDLGSEACCTTDNYISKEFAAAYKNR